MHKKKKVIVVVGPTGSGKSGIAFQIAKKFDGFLISADSRQLYQGMDIGTNKDLGKWVKVNGKNIFKIDDIEEHLVDFIQPDQEFTLDDWLKACKKIINEKEQLPIVVGGTGLYTTALVEGYELKGGQDKELRQKFEQQLNEFGLPYLVNQLKKIDSNIEHKIDTKNSRRVIRALEICLKTKKPLKFNKQEGNFEFLQLGVRVDREKLYQKINKRVDQMIKQGLIEEVKVLLKKGYKKDLPAMSGIGYRQIVQYLDEEIDLTEAVRLIKRDTRRYAKRQMTWYKRDKSIKWVKDYQEAEKLVKKFIKN